MEVQAKETLSFLPKLLLVSVSQPSNTQIIDSSLVMRVSAGDGGDVLEKVGADGCTT